MRGFQAKNKHDETVTLTAFFLEWQGLNCFCYKNTEIYFYFIYVDPDETNMPLPKE